MPSLEPTIYDLVDQRGKSVYLLKDGDTKFTAKFYELFKSEGVKVKRLPYASPNLNAHAERFVQSIKHECLDKFVVFGERHLEHLIREYEYHYNTVRPHQGIGNKPIRMTAFPPSDTGPCLAGKIQCAERLGGLLRHYWREHPTVLRGRSERFPVGRAINGLHTGPNSPPECDNNAAIRVPW